MPLMTFLFPSSFMTKYPTAYANMKKNADKLTTPLDVYATLKDVLELNGDEKTIWKTKSGVHPKGLFNSSLLSFR